MIGKPGTGCTTFLKTLAGMWEEYKDVQGELTFGGHSITRTTSERPQDVVFCGGSDIDMKNFYNEQMLIHFIYFQTKGIVTSRR